MPANTLLFETAIIISPDEQLKKGNDYQQLPTHINVVDPFLASYEQTNRLQGKIAFPLRRNIFEITGLEHKGRGAERIHRLGGAVLHHLRDEVIIDAMDRLRIVHDNVAWAEGTKGTWYSGTWQVPNQRTKVDRIHLAQELPGTQNWKVLHTFDLESLPPADFKNDPDYHKSLSSSGRKQKQPKAS